MAQKEDTGMKNHQDPRWQKKRLEILSRDRFVCLGCGAADKPLHVHHLYYCKGRSPWEYPNWALETRCEDCHAPESQTLRDPDGTFVLYDWERTIEILSGGNPSNFAGGGDLWDIAATIDGLPITPSHRHVLEHILDAVQNHDFNTVLR